MQQANHKHFITQLVGVGISGVKRYPINDISVAQIDIRISNGHSAYQKLCLSLFPLK